MEGAVRSREVHAGGKVMLIMRKKLYAAILGLVLLFAATTTTNAQSWRYRDRDRFSKGEKAAVIGGGAAAGAVIGGLLGGKKGAILGGLLGAGGGTGYVILKDRNNDDDWRYRGRYYRSNRFFESNRRFDNNRWNRFDRRWYRR